MSFRRQHQSVVGSGQTKARLPCERTVRMAVEEAIREASRSFRPSEVHGPRYALAMSVVVLTTLKDYSSGWKKGSGSGETDDLPDDEVEI